MDKGLGQRLFNFSVKVILLTRTLSDGKEYDVIKYQLTKSATSSGANYEEAQAASSKLDFRNKIKISLKEMRESNYWLKIIKAVSSHSEELDLLISESEELKKILGSISSRVSKSIQ
ncbi:MAG: four helix bundle protein [Ignavibacteriae bacterium]|nr:four helix bundle protein [Ignavibacteriota bacterium]|tara:strand:+ start:154 stop:504 length:351 start_codon:yes stop_codon:yes gene_type:complete